jgi:hypothetical protein
MISAMSDETPPSPLRLKPRTRVEAGETPKVESSPAAPENPGAAANTGEPPKLRLRPKLDLGAAAANPTPPEPVAEKPAPTSPPPISLKPRLTSPIEPAAEPQSAHSPSADSPAASAGAEPPKFKLKPKPAAAVDVVAPAAPVVLPPPIPSSVARTDSPAPAAVSTPPPFPVVASSEGSKAPFPPPIPTARRTTPPFKPTVAPPKSSKPVVKILLGAVLVLLAVGAFLVFRGGGNTPPQPEVVPTVSKPAATPSATLNELASAPAKAINKAEEMIAAANATRQVNEELTSADPTAVRPAKSESEAEPTFVRRKPAPKAEPPPAPTTSKTELAPGLTATTAAKDVAGEASPAFRNWVAQARISGVFKGNPARALINGRTVTSGQVIDEALGITFVGIAADSKSLMFSDASGSTVMRRF